MRLRVLLVFASTVAMAQNVPEAWSTSPIDRLCFSRLDSKIFTIGPGLDGPVLVSKVNPVQTSATQNAVVSAVVDTDGRTCVERVVRSLGPEADQSAIEAVRRW